MEKQDLNIWMVQLDTSWHNPEANRGHIEELISQQEGNADLIMLPEMFSTGFTMSPEEVAEPMNFHTQKWMRLLAERSGAVVTGSIVIKDGSSYFNRLIWMKPNGEFQKYDKRHLFRMAKEHYHYGAGVEKIIVDLKGWRVCPLVCYDLRFPVYSRNIDLGYDLLLYVANWPERRVNSWDTLLQARAMENLAYVAGVNRVGQDGYDVAYNGHSAVYGPKGEVITFLEGREEILKATLSYAGLQKFREKFPAHLDADRFDLRV